MSFLTGQDQTSKFARQVLPVRTESGLIFKHFIFQVWVISSLKNLVSTILLDQINKQKFQNKIWFFFLSSKVLIVQCPGRKTSGFLDSPYSEKFPDFQTGGEMTSGRTLFFVIVFSANPQLNKKLTRPLGLNVRTLPWSTLFNVHICPIKKEELRKVVFFRAEKIASDKFFMAIFCFLTFHNGD